MPSQSLSKSTLAMLLTLLMLGANGCQQHATGKLLGRWVGTPDTAASRGKRELQKYGDTTEVSDAISDATLQPLSAESVTDWESYDLRVSLDFIDHERVEMSLSGDSAPEGLARVSGKWRIVSTTPIGCTIELETAGEATHSKSEQPTAVVRRQFQLDLDEREGECVGFTLMEVGADRQLGTLHFSRPDKSE